MPWDDMEFFPLNIDPDELRHDLRGEISVQESARGLVVAAEAVNLLFSSDKERDWKDANAAAPGSSRERFAVLLLDGRPSRDRPSAAVRALGLFL